MFAVDGCIVKAFHIYSSFAKAAKVTQPFLFKKAHFVLLIVAKTNEKSETKDICVF